VTLLTLAATGALAAPASADRCPAAPIDLGALLGDVAVAVAVGPGARVVGWSLNADRVPQAVTWRGDRIVPLPIPPDSQALDVNRDGTIVGTFKLAGRDQPFSLAGGRMTALPLAAGMTGGWARKINRAGIAAGWMTDANGNDHAALWTRAGQPVLLDIPPRYTASRARAINRRAEVAGEALDSTDGVLKAFRITERGFELLPGLDATGATRAFDIDDHGRVSGTAGVAPTDHAVTWTPDGAVRALQEPTASTRSQALTINEHGTAAGNSSLPGDPLARARATLWRNGGPPMLLPPLGGRITVDPANILDLRGDTAVGTSATPSGSQHAALWRCASRLAVPVPEGAA
jgi:uncharacterized membrane protein